MDEIKFQELMKREDVVKKVFEAKTSKELESVLKKEGLEINEAELKQLMSSITQTSSPGEIKSPTIPTPIPLSNNQSANISSGGGNGYPGYTFISKGSNESRPGELVYHSYEPYPEENSRRSPYSFEDESSDQGIFLPRKRSLGTGEALAGIGIAGALGGGYALYKKFKSRKK